MINIQSPWDIIGANNKEMKFLNLIRYSTVLLLVTMSCSRDQTPTEISRFYDEFKESSFIDYKNWHIYPSRDRIDVWAFDHFLSDTLIERYILKEEDNQVLYKKVLPKLDTAYYSFDGQSTAQSELQLLDLYNHFSSLAINGVFYDNQSNYILLKIDDNHRVIHLLKGGDISKLKSNYLKIDEEWYYYNYHDQKE